MQSWKAYLAHLEFPAPKISWYDADFIQDDHIQACNVRQLTHATHKVSWIVTLPQADRELSSPLHMHEKDDTRTLDVSLIPNRCMEDGFEWSPKLTPILRIMWQDDAEN
jgi:hypothetical protein